MRLFIAIELPQNVRREIVKAAGILSARAERLRAVAPENVHITLRFLGETDNLNGAVCAMRESVRGIRPFPLHLGGYGYFGKGSATSYIDVLGDLRELGALYESLESALYDEGFPREYKKFTPHITLARGVYQDEALINTMRALKLNASMQVGGITLFESQRARHGMVYSPLHRENF